MFQLSDIHSTLQKLPDNLFKMYFIQFYTTSLKNMVYSHNHVSAGPHPRKQLVQSKSYNTVKSQRTQQYTIYDCQPVFYASLIICLHTNGHQHYFPRCLWVRVIKAALLHIQFDSHSSLSPMHT